MNQLIYSMGVSADGFIADRAGQFDWPGSAPSDDLFRLHLDRVNSLGAYLLGRKLYETMSVWEADPSLRETELHAEFADAWTALPKIVFSRSLDRVTGSNARFATQPVAEEIAAALAMAERDVEIGGADLAAQAIELGLVDELRIFRYPVIVGGGTPFLPPIATTIPMALIETRGVDAHVIYERYRCLRDTPH